MIIIRTIIAVRTYVSSYVLASCYHYIINVRAYVRTIILRIIPSDYHIVNILSFMRSKNLHTYVLAKAVTCFVLARDTYQYVLRQIFPSGYSCLKTYKGSSSGGCKCPRNMWSKRRKMPFACHGEANLTVVCCHADVRNRYYNIKKPKLKSYLGLACLALPCNKKYCSPSGDET